MSVWQSDYTEQPVTDGHMQVVLFWDTQTMLDVLWFQMKKKVICEVECMLERIKSIYNLTINMAIFEV